MISILPLPTWLRWTGVGVALAGFGLLQWVQQTLGKNWSDAPQLVSGQALISSGPYRWIRHPIYSAFLLNLSSLPPITANWFISGLWIGMTGVDISARVKAEEAMLVRKFGEPYLAYMRRTGALFPKSRSWKLFVIVCERLRRSQTT
jgi:protein-S-isoprenylcysteine O-methyltransferase Ste14